MGKTKRDVDNHWSEIDRKIPSEQERNLKAFTVAKLYFNVGELDQAIKFLDKYDSARKNAPQSFRLRGRIYEAMASRAASNEEAGEGNGGGGSLEKHLKN